MTCNEPFGFFVFANIFAETDAAINYSARTLHVPAQASLSYQLNLYWCPYFGRIVEDMLAGDVNGDGRVNISDVTALIDYVLSDDASRIQLAGADYNHDGRVNISDVTALIDYLLNSAGN